MSRLITIPRLRWAGIAALLFLVGAYVALPLLASTRLVRDSIAVKLSEWSGYRVSIAGSPRIDVWPNFRAILTDVSLSEWQNAGTDPVIAVPRLEIDLSPLAVLQGRVEFSTARFIGPALRLERRDGRLFLPPLPLEGRMARSIGQVRTVVAANPDNPDLSQLPSDVFGSIEVLDGRIVAGDGPDRTEFAAHLSGALSWPALDRPGTLEASGEWRGEKLRIGVRSDEPLLLLAGGLAQISASLTSRPLSLSFNGKARGGDLTVQGPAKLSSPSLGSALSWLDGGEAAGLAEVPVSASAQLFGQLSDLKLDMLEMTFGENSAIGVIDLSLAGAAPSLSGTLAFETVDLLAAFSAFSPGEGRGIGWPSWWNWSDVDLRLSAESAIAGPVEISDVAASANIRDGLSVFDVSDGAAFGGRVQAGLRIDRRIENGKTEIRFLAEDIDGAALGKATGLAQVIPSSHGTISLTLKGAGTQPMAIVEHANGTLQASFGKGTFPEFDLQSFIGLVGRGGFFTLADVSRKPLAIEAATLRASASDGVVRIDTAEVKTANRRVVLSGLAQIAGQGLALAGTVVPAALGAGTAAQADARFFVGGSWSAPFISSSAPNVPFE